MGYKDTRRKGDKSTISIYLKGECGVSPVIGVMLMLVVTIIIAAVVASFATGLAPSAEGTPTAGFDYTIHAGPVSGDNPPVRVLITASTGEMSSNDLQIITTYTVPNTYNGMTLSNAGKVITHTIDGRLENYGMSLKGGGATSFSFPDDMLWHATEDPFVPHTHLYPYIIVPSNGNGLTVGDAMNEQLYFGGNAPISSGTLWWFKNIDHFLGFDVSDKTQYGFGEGSLVHITIIHIPTGNVLSDKDVMAVW